VSSAACRCVLSPLASPRTSTRATSTSTNDQLDEELVASWIRQALELPGWVPVAREGSSPAVSRVRFEPRNRRNGKNIMRKSGSQKEKSPSQMIDERIRELGDWRGKMLSRLRSLIKQADPEVVEEWKWRGVPVWSHAGMICTGETYKNVVKMTFAKGASLEDPSRLFNSSLEGNTRRAIDFHEGDKIDEKALKGLIRAAVALNTSVRATARPVRSQKRPKSA
jgi:hypothetical protein